MMKRGILLIAIGHPAYFEMARNLAVSIKANDPDAQIALATDQPPVISEEGVFDHLVHVPEKMYMHQGKKEWIKVKTHMYDLSPFDDTIFLDVDMILLKDRKITPFFEELKEVNWTIANTGIAEVSIWAEISEVRSAYETENPFYNYHSEFVYFKKGKEVKKYFDLVKKVFCDPKVKGTVFGGARIADELAFQIASMILNFYPHQEVFNPTFWWARDKSKAYTYLYLIPAEMISYSIGGNNIPDHVKNNYNNMASFYFDKLGLQSPYLARPKKLFLAERQKI